MLIRLLRKTISHWSLEQKSLLFFGSGLLVSICISFWFIQNISEGLVLETTRQAARDHAGFQIARRHYVRGSDAGNELSSAPSSSGFWVDPSRFSGQPFSAQALEALSKLLVDNPNYEVRILMPENSPAYEHLHSAVTAIGSDRDIINVLEKRYRDRWREREAEIRKAAIEAEKQSTGTIAQTATNQTVSVGSESLIFDERTDNDRFYYYHIVPFDRSPRCIECHFDKTLSPPSARARPISIGDGMTSEQSFAADVAPFRVVRVSIPYETTRASAAKMLAYMIAIAMVTVAATLLTFHFILRKLVIRPLQYLRNVSDEISRGRYNLRAEIGTDDEFHELAEAFNRMLRHWTESQEQQRSLNQELDVKVDQLAQANFKLYEANRLKSDFLANMSHELRTPLNSIIGFSDVLHDISSLTDKQKRYAANIQKSGRLLLEMINDILDLAKIEAGKMQVRPTSFDVGHIVHSQCDMMRSLSEEKNIDLQIDVDKQLEPVFQDQPKIQQLLTNLLSNAIKFTPEGGLINVSVGADDLENFFIAVQDTGVGIPESEFEIIFEKFRQSSTLLDGDNLTRRHSGTGLGLSIVKELCKLLGGEIKLSSEIGRGSTFRVVLPMTYHSTFENVAGQVP